MQTNRPSDAYCLELYEDPADGQKFKLEDSSRHKKAQYSGYEPDRYSQDVLAVETELDFLRSRGDFDDIEPALFEKQIQE